MGYAGTIQQVESERMRSDLPSFRAGDTVVVQVRVREGNRERLQAFEGIVLAKRNRGLNSSFIVRRIAHGVGVERSFQTHSPIIDSITVKRRGDVRKAKLYYLRNLTGRKARIKEKISARKEFAELVSNEQAEVPANTKSADSAPNELSEDPKDVASSQETS